MGKEKSDEWYIRYISFCFCGSIAHQTNLKSGRQEFVSIKELLSHNLLPMRIDGFTSSENLVIPCRLSVNN